MQQPTRPSGLDRPPLRSQRSSSISSDRASLSVAPLPFPPTVRPDPAYIAPIAASQIVTGDHESAIEEEEYDGQEPLNALVTPAALCLVNAFLDQLLYSFLASSRSTSIASLRPSVAEVLKPRLAKDAIASADEELQEMGGGEDDEELSALHHGVGLRGDWDLNLIWQRTRLRCMVYTHLGDLEESDEEMWIERENLHSKVDGGRNRLSRDLGAVSPTVAIFLTAILEFIGEQVLLVAGKAAYTRFETRRRQEKYTSSNAIDGPRPTVEVVDVEKLAVSTTFGRLWRSWKKKVRSPSITSQRPSSRDLLLRSGSSLSTSESRSRNASFGEAGEHALGPGTFRRPSTAEDREKVFEAAATPLPAAVDDVKDFEGNEVRTWDSHRELNDRPTSMMMPSNSGPSTEQLNGGSKDRASNSRPGLSEHHRSSSLPHLASRDYLSPQPAFSPTFKDSSYPITPPDSANGYFRHDASPSGVTTMYDGAIMRETSAIKGRGDETTPSVDTQGSQPGVDERMMSMNGYSEEMPLDTQQAHLRSEPNEKSFDDKQQVSLQEPDKDSASSTMSSRIDNLLSQVENGYNSKQTQGYTARNASLENRETAIVETTPQALTHEDTSLQPSDDEATRSDDQEYRNTIAELRGPTSYAKYDQVDGGSSSDGDYGSARYGAAIRPYPDGATNHSPTFAQIKPGAKVSDIRKQLPPVSTGVERATVQRVSQSSSSALDSPVGRTSTSSSRDIRPLHTSGSISSQKAAKAKSLGGRESSDNTRQFAVSRTSSDGSASIVRTPKNDETQRSFEQLIKSDETIQYTLTPQSVRETDSPDSPSYSRSRSGTAELADFIRTSGPPPAESNRPTTARSIVSLKGLDGLRSNNSKPAPMPTSAPALEKPKTPAQRSRPTTSRSAHGAPRDAQLASENTRDFADFIRSTGPEERPGAISQRDGAASPSPVKQRPNKSLVTGQRSSSATSTSKKITKPNPSLSKSPPPVVSSPPPRRTSKLEARGATYEPTHNEDLLDFLKQGPAEDRIGIERRPMPGPVASVVPQNPHASSNLRFRASDNTRSSLASTQDSSFAADKSIRSTNSRTGLLDSPRGPAHTAGSRSPSSSKPIPHLDGGPARKQRRVKDPYAIDTDSENENEGGTPKPPHHHRDRGGESLLDFLSSTPPPADDTGFRIPSAFDDLPSPTSTSGSLNNNNNSPVVGRNKPPQQPAVTASARSAAQQAQTLHSQLQSQQRGRALVNNPPSHKPSQTAPQLPPLDTRDTSPHLMTNYPLPSSTNPTTIITSNNPNIRPPPPTLTNQFQTPPHRDFPSNTSGAAGVGTNKRIPVKPPGIARSERESPRGTGDLADFLKNSEPPTQVPEELFRGNSNGAGSNARRDGVEEKEKGGGVWGRLKGRRKAGR